jgi:hypothetical protein
MALGVHTASAIYPDSDKGARGTADQPAWVNQLITRGDEALHRCYVQCAVVTSVWELWQ